MFCSFFGIISKAWKSEVKTFVLTEPSLSLDQHASYLTPSEGAEFDILAWTLGMTRKLRAYPEWVRLVDEKSEARTRSVEDVAIEVLIIASVSLAK